MTDLSHFIQANSPRPLWAKFNNEWEHIKILKVFIQLTILVSQKKTLIMIIYFSNSDNVLFIVLKRQALKKNMDRFYFKKRPTVSISSLVLSKNF